ncbi:uncharacterized protein FSUBG_10704 [Fusarium subglutinans]|uniref:Uncharacterized protein n=1 Tax=Gibberella subglutinans TaxID=42677 RepID=A0A8H5LGR4_GIBSU|nr:uncharacterized protein FSUBG_10704 [Fusarium subglutinans]KAF5590840.1 hypothetical protein FSUBG_10704 [Fusarium subglutinans]
MARYQQFERLPATRDLFKNRIRTLKEFREVLEDSYFIALDTEHVAITSESDRVLHQVGLAFTKTLNSRHPPCEVLKPGIIRPKRRLWHFFEDNDMKGLTLNVDTSKKLGDEVLRVGGFKGMPIRRPHRFGEEKTVDVEDLEASVVEFLSNLPRDKKLVLVGFGMGAEWLYLSANFPAAIRFFSSWVDLGDIVVDITSSAPSFFPSLQFLIQTFGYWRTDVRPASRHRTGGNAGNADNAGDDVVTTLALAQALLEEKNYSALLFDHACFRIASWGKPRPFCDSAKCFIATVRSEAELPNRICTGIKIARQFIDFHPVGTGLISSEVGFITFESQEELDHFIGCVDGMVLHTGETLSAQRYIHIDTKTPETPEDQKLKEEKRIMRRVKRESNNDEVVELGGLFS